ncbi:MAG: DUF4428 domain-containing protein, partial [Eggerthellaceae bacterium]|nr:DUF4428 domain-containing protein [Eggerthellaceae bacterium]
SCGACGKELGLLGKRKLEDGYICKDCANKLSPFFSERRRSTIAEINEQLAYREANKESVAALNITRTLGGGTRKVMIDEDARKFIITGSSKWRDENPDVIDFSQVTGCDVDVREHRTEIKKENEDGTKESYDPPRWDLDYDVYVTIHVNSPWFDEIEFRTNSSTIEQRGSIEFNQAEQSAIDIRDVLTGVRQLVRDEVVAANTPKKAVTCPHCMASTIPDAQGRCEYCGGAL